MGKAMSAGIKTICLERDIVEPNYTTYIACDNLAIGRQLASSSSSTSRKSTASRRARSSS
jgi:ABC-type sugar transport system substrate-binding protein